MKMLFVIQKYAVKVLKYQEFPYVDWCGLG